MHPSPYMSEEPTSLSLRTFLEDLVLIREQRGVSLDDIRVKTKVYPHVIAQFEEDGLRNHPLFNKLYTKAFVRSYALALGASPEVIVSSYEKALSDAYQRELAIEYLDMPLPPGALEVPLAVSVSDEQIDTHGASSGVDNTADVEHVFSLQGGGDISPETKTSLTDLKQSKHSNPNVPSVSWRSLTEIFRNHSGVQWGIAGGAIGLFLLLIFSVISIQKPESPLSASTAITVQETTSISSVSTLPDSLTDRIPTTSIGTEESDTTPDAVPFTLGDSLSIIVVAAGGKLDPFRVRVDADLRRPYWLDTGDSMRFKVGERIVIEEKLDVMEVLLEGYTIPINDTDSAAQLVITRDSARVLLGQVR